MGSSQREHQGKSGAGLEIRKGNANAGHSVDTPHVHFDVSFFFPLKKCIILLYMSPQAIQ